MAGFDWPALMRAGFQGLGLSPEKFWALTPAEFQLLLGVTIAGASMDRARLDELVRAFPDAIERSADDGF